jgi:hypothetical protein
MKRPSFQFYPGDWRKNSKLRRCSEAARGAWMDILCVLHDSDEYGICRWPLVELARAAGIPIKLAKELASKGVLKGADSGCPPYVFTPRHAGKDGESVTLVQSSEQPCWYCSRFVRDEYLRQKRGQSTRFGTTNQPQEEEPKATPKPPFGTRQGDGPSSSSSSSIDKHTSADASLPTRFREFWEAWPSTDRKVAKAKCEQRWKARKLDTVADQILAHVGAMKGSKAWKEGYEPAPLTYLNQSRWEDGVHADRVEADTPWAGAI